MITRTINLQISPEREGHLLKYNENIEKHLERKLPLDFSVLNDLFVEMSEVVAENPEIAQALENQQETLEHLMLNLQHPDNRILNLPWMKARNTAKDELSIIKNLYISKSLPGYFHAEKTTGKLPLSLKVLVMISSPEDIDLKSRLSYEEEELLLLKAFEKLMESGLVEIDFADDASLETLERKIHENHYHIFHFSGHAVYNDQEQQGFLQMEDPVTMNTINVSADDFVQALNAKEKHKPSLVVISSCQSARGSTEAGLRGISNQLMKLGIPAVVSMGWSIGDLYASQFSACMFGALANSIEKYSLLESFKLAVEHLKNFEVELQSKAGIHVNPLQYIIPNLYLSQECEDIIDWEKQPEPLNLKSGRYLFFREKLVIDHDKDYLFIGRRKDKRNILPKLFAKEPVMLKGQGGVGKTALAEHLVQRIISQGKHNKKDFEVFVFSEKTGMPEFLARIKMFVDSFSQSFSEGDYTLINSEVGKFIYLLKFLKEIRTPVFVFDNLESFQENKGGKIKEEHAGLAEIIAALVKQKDFHLILTSRYPLVEDAFTSIPTFDLNHVPLNDFWKKCHNLEIKIIAEHFQQQVKERIQLKQEKFTFSDIVKYLHQSFGGNYRALEFFSKKIKNDAGNIGKTLESLKTFREKYKDAELEVLQEMSKNLFFNELLSLLSPAQTLALHRLSQFNIPVTEVALTMQDLNGTNPEEQEKSIAFLHRLMLIEKHLQPPHNIEYLYVTPLIKGLLEENPMKNLPGSFSHDQAGYYHLYAFHNLGNLLSDWEEAFNQFLLACNKQQVGKLGEGLTRFYYENSLFQKAYFFALKSYEFLQKDTPSEVLNNLGLILNLFGQNDPALYFYELALEKYRKEKNKKAEGILLNNISHIYSVKGNYHKALEFLEQSLKISREIGDKAGEGTTLNNISQIYKAWGNYQKTLEFLDKSLKIMRVVGNRKDEGKMLNSVCP